MRDIISICIVIAAAIAFGVANAAESEHTMVHAMKHEANDSASNIHMGKGVVNKIDLQHGKVNLTHGPIKSLGWPGMTMDFKVKDVALLKRAKPGQKVNFEVVKEGPGEFFITRITPLK